MPARLHHELIAPADAPPERWLAITHGIFGAGNNWRGIARKLVGRRAGWGVVLVDLRQHGRSEPGEPPHDLAACAADVLALVDELAARGVTIAAVAGHSFGGKVVLEARRHARSTLRQTWILDASPSARPGAIDDPANTVTRVLALLERSLKRWARRDDFVAAVVADGHDVGLGQWLATNLVPAASADGALVLRLDLVAIRAMLVDYFARDLWDVVERGELAGDVEYVVADRAATVSAADRARLANAPAHVHVHHIDAGHWLHIDAPGAVVDTFALHLVEPS